MNTAFTLSSIGGIAGAVILFIVLKKVVGLVFRLVMAVVLVGAVVLGAWLWSRPSSEASPGNNNRPQRTRRQ